MPETPAPTDHISPESLPPVGILSRGGSSVRNLYRRSVYFRGAGQSSRSRLCGVSAIHEIASANHACESTSVSFAVWINVYMIAARLEPVKSHGFRPKELLSNVVDRAVMNQAASLG
jgi:hypothetical protein